MLYFRPFLRVLRHCYCSFFSCKASGCSYWCLFLVSSYFKPRSCFLLVLLLFPCSVYRLFFFGRSSFNIFFLCLVRYFCTVFCVSAVDFCLIMRASKVSFILLLAASPILSLVVSLSSSCLIRVLRNLFEFCPILT